MFKTCEDLIGDMTSSLSDLTLVYSNNNEYLISIILLLQNIKRYMAHIHRSHYHFKDHSYSKIDNTLPGEPSSILISPVQHWLLEIFTQEDMDNNGLIYGQHFIIDPMDKDKPRSLTLAEDTLISVHETKIPYCDYVKNFNTNNSIGSNILSFKTALSALNSSNRSQPMTLFGELAYEIITKDNSYHKEIYCKDFIADPNDPEKPQFLTNLEKECPCTYWKVIPWSRILSYRGYKETPVTEPSRTPCDYIQARLLGEWMNSMDIDGNGLIYGIDFILDNNDPNKSRCLQDIEYDVDWNPSEDIKIFSWEEYCSTFPNNNPDDRE